MKIKIMIIFCLISYSLSSEEKVKIKIKVSANPDIEGSFYLKQESGNINKLMKLNEEFELDYGSYGFLFENEEYIGYTEKFLYKDKEEKIIIDLMSKYAFNYQYKRSHYYTFRRNQKILYSFYLVGGLFPATNIIGVPYLNQFTLISVLYFPYIMVPYGCINISNFVAGVVLFGNGIDYYFNKNDKEVGGKLLIGSAVCLSITYLFNSIYSIIWSVIYIKDNKADKYEYLEQYLKVEENMKKRSKIDLNFDFIDKIVYAGFSFKL